MKPSSLSSAMGGRAKTSLVRKLQDTFFLTKRSIYILVADTRRQHTDFYDWLKMQETFREKSDFWVSSVTL